MDLKIYYPHKPYFITQHWGNPNPAYEQLGFKLHNGVDANIAANVSEFRVNCPVQGFVVESVSFEENGGGNQLSLVSKEKLQVGDKKCYARIFICHAKKILVPVGYEPKLGELILIADNTGFSTGLHTHMGLYRLDDKKRKLDKNDATGSYNPEWFFTGEYAVDKANYQTLLSSALRYYIYRAGLKLT
jgi:murein DD-endopeptidase MepM/ murein hydrolase activator NlpD